MVIEIRDGDDWVEVLIDGKPAITGGHRLSTRDVVTLLQAAGVTVIVPIGDFCALCGGTWVPHGETCAFCAEYDAENPD